MARAGFASITLVLALAGAAVSAAQSGSAALVSLTGQPAPEIESGLAIGPHLPRPGMAPREPQLLFFWAHWCQECKGESPILARIAEKYRTRGLTVIAPTRRYGYGENGRPAAPDRELRHIVQVRDESYPFLRHVPVPVSDANYAAYGVAAVPTHVLIDRNGIVRLFQPGRMTQGELDAAIARVLEP
jgi:thiol-disulfide isomerase/thioredoxin